MAAIRFRSGALIEATPDIAAALFRHLAERGWRLSEPIALSGGRSNHVWRAGDVVVKLYREGGENPLFANDPARERKALQALSGTGMVPRYLDHGVWEGRAWLIYGHLSGAAWQEDTGHVARLLGIVHDQIGFEGVPLGVNGSRALERQTDAILARCSKAGALSQYRPQGLVPPVAQVVLIHGDPVPGNLMAHDGTLALIDWQCPQRGDPAEDLALFLSPAMQLLYRGRPLDAAEEAQFVAAYPDRRVVARYFALYISKFTAWQNCAGC